MTDLVEQLDEAFRWQGHILFRKAGAEIRQLRMALTDEWKRERRETHNEALEEAAQMAKKKGAHIAADAIRALKGEAMADQEELSEAKQYTIDRLKQYKAENKKLLAEIERLGRKIKRLEHQVDLDMSAINVEGSDHD